MLQLQRMDQALADAGVAHELMVWDGLDHYLEDSTARAQMLSKSEIFIRQAIGKSADV